MTNKNLKEGSLTIKQINKKIWHKTHLYFEYTVSNILCCRASEWNKLNQRKAISCRIIVNMFIVMVCWIKISGDIYSCQNMIFFTIVSHEIDGRWLFLVFTQIVPETYISPVLIPDLFYKVNRIFSAHQDLHHFYFCFAWI